MAVDFRASGEAALQVGPGVPPQMRQHARLRAAEIIDEPVIDFGHDQPSGRVGARPARAVDVDFRRGGQHAVHRVARVGLGRQVGAADGCTVDRVMQAGVAPDRTQDAVFDIVEGKFFTFHLGQFLAPGPVGK